MAIYEFPISDPDIPDLYVKDIDFKVERGATISLGSYAGEQAADNEDPDLCTIFVGVYLTHKEAETLALSLLAELTNQGYDWRENQNGS